MRALVLSNLFPPHSLGGYEQAGADVVARWLDGGHDVRVVTSVHRVAGVADAEQPHVERRLPSTSLFGTPAPRRHRAKAERAARAVIDDAIDDFAPDLVVVWNPAGVPFSAVLRAVERGRPVLFVVADPWPARLDVLDPWMAAFRGNRWRRAAGRLAAVAFRVPTTIPRLDRLGTWAFCSAALRAEVATATGLPFDDAAVVPLGVDTRDFPIAAHPDAERRWGWRLLFVGRLEPVKGIDTLVRALPSLPGGTTLDVCGPDEPEHVARVRRLAERLGVGDRVRIGPAPRHELAARYRRSDACVFPSEWAEPFGIVPLESMACATPVVASATGGSGEYLRNEENCVVASPGDPEAIAAALHRLAADPVLRAQVVRGGLTTAAAYTTDQLAARLAALAQQVLQRH